MISHTISTSAMASLALLKPNRWGNGMYMAGVQEHQALSLWNEVYLAEAILVVAAVVVVLMVL
jgi:hypothetical protein